MIDPSKSLGTPEPPKARCIPSHRVEAEHPRDPQDPRCWWVSDLSEFVRLRGSTSVIPDREGPDNSVDSRPRRLLDKHAIGLAWRWKVDSANLSSELDWV